VDDELSLQRLYEMVLEIHGHEVIGKCCNGDEAVQLYKNSTEKPDLVIMDHRMPIKNGIQATREIKELDPNAKIIIATADEEVQEIANSLGVMSFKLKPFSNQRLVNNVKKALKKSPIPNII
jgi:two-component system chemotaxis response regulator CheY